MTPELEIARRYITGRRHKSYDISLSTVVGEHDGYSVVVVALDPHDGFGTRWLVGETGRGSNWYVVLHNGAQAFQQADLRLQKRRAAAVLKKAGA